MRGRIVIPESFDLCFTYEQQILYLAKWCGMLADAIGGPGSPAIDALNDAVDKINKTVEEIEISLTNFYNKGEIDVKFAGYYNKEESDNKYETKTDAQSAHDRLTAMIDSRALNVDSAVTAGSKKPVESGAVKAYVDAEIAKIRGGN